MSGETLQMVWIWLPVNVLARRERRWCAANSLWWQSDSSLTLLFLVPRWPSLYGSGLLLLSTGQWQRLPHWRNLLCPEWIVSKLCLSLSTRTNDFCPVLYLVVCTRTILQCGRLRGRRYVVLRGISMPCQYHEMLQRAGVCSDERHLLWRGEVLRGWSSVLCGQ